MTVHYYDLISRDAHALHWAVNSANYSDTQASRVCYAISAIAIAIFNAHWYLGRALIDRNWDDISEAGKSLAFALATLHNIFFSLFYDNVFAPPHAWPIEHHPHLEHGHLHTNASVLHDASSSLEFVPDEDAPPTVMDVFAPPRLDNAQKEDAIEQETFPLALVSAQNETAAGRDSLPRPVATPPNEPARLVGLPVQYLAAPAKEVELSYDSIPISIKELDALKIIAIQVGTATFLSPPNPIITIPAGAVVDNLHPFRFIGFFLSDKILDRNKTPKQLLRAIRHGGDGTKPAKTGFYWGKFVGPLSESFKKRLEQKDIYPYLKSFAATFGADEHHTASFFKPLNCVGLVDYLLGL